MCRILEAGAKYGVAELNFHGLSVKFGQPAGWGPIPDNPSSAPISSDLTEIQHTELAKDSLEKEEVQTREDQLAELLVTDPMAYEELLRNGDLDEFSGRNGDEIDDEPAGE